MRLSVRTALLSMAAVALAAPLAAPAEPAKGSWMGRWTVSDEQPVFTARGQPYRTIDFAPCGKDFCGVSVGAGGKCGPTLFRFLRKRTGDFDLRGHGVWGKERKNVVMNRWDRDGADPAGMELYLGDGYDLGGRSGSMPKFHAGYKLAGAARCKVA